MEHKRKWRVRKDEHNDHGACKVYEITCRVSLTVLGCCYIYYYLFYVVGDFGHVLLGNDVPCKIVGTSKVQIKLNNRNEWLLKDVRHIPAMKIILISIGKVGDSGFFSTFEKMLWKITK